MKEKEKQTESLAAVHTHTHTHTDNFREKGITLVALVVTIVVLLILAGVSINLVLGNNGIITKAKESRTETRMSQIDEQVKLAIGDAYTDGIGSITDSGLKSALNNHIGEGTYDITGDETTGWKVTVKETGKVYEISANGKMDSSIDWDKIIEEANKNPESFKHEDQSETNKDIGIGTDGKPVNMDLWTYSIINTNEIVLSKGEGSHTEPGYLNKNIENGKIKGKVPEYIKPDGKDEFYRVTSINGTFFQCEDLAEIPELPSGVTTIGNYSFFDCTSLENVTILERMTEIGYMAFAQCYSLNDIKIPDNVTSIGNYAFAWCTNLTSITIPESVASIGGSAFCECTNLTSITIPDSVISIGDYAFDGCTGLTSITIPESVISIGDYAFDGCTGLTSITIPESVASIGNYAFASCFQLQGIEVNEKNKYYLSENGVLFDKNKKTIIAYPTGKSGESYDIPDSVTSIGKGAFSGRTGLTSITIPESVTSIGESAFSGCTGLTSITIPENVTLIGWSAFNRCDALADVYFEGTTAPKISSWVFYKSSGAKTTFHFKNQTVYDAFTEDYYNKNYGEKSTDFNW